MWRGQGEMMVFSNWHGGGGSTDAMLVGSPRSHSHLVLARFAAKDRGGALQLVMQRLARREQEGARHLLGRGGGSRLRESRMEQARRSLSLSFPRRGNPVALAPFRPARAAPSLNTAGIGSRSALLCAPRSCTRDFARADACAVSRFLKRSLFEKLQRSRPS